MNALNKILIAATMVVTLGATTSCGNKDNEAAFVGGLPYTLFTLSRLESGNRYEVKFECEGEPEVYWDSETPTHEKSHVFDLSSNTRRAGRFVLIKGNVDNLHFCDENGNLLANGNANISTIIFSNTITKLPAYACYSLGVSKTNNSDKGRHFFYLPASIRTIGKNAFCPYNEDDLKYFVCEPTSRPSGWDPDWCTVGELARFMSWGFSYYITDNYDMYYIINDDPIRTACYEGNLQYDLENLVIPETFNVGNVTCQVVSIASIGNSRETLKSVTIPKSIVAINGGAFRACLSLTTVKFANEYEYLWFGPGVFQNCSSLKTITLPKGLVNIPANTLDGCTYLSNVVIPNTVQAVDSYIFWYVQGDESTKKLTVNLTSYTDANQIASCGNILDKCTAETVTFKINSQLKEKDFTDKGWPKTTEEPAQPKVVWEGGSTLNA